MAKSCPSPRLNTIVGIFHSEKKFGKFRVLIEQSVIETHLLPLASMKPSVFGAPSGGGGRY